LQHDKTNLILIQTFLQEGQGFADFRAVLPCRSLLGFGADEAISENGLDQFKGFLPFCLASEQSVYCFTLASPLPIPMWEWASHIFADLLPGRPCPFTPKLIEVRSQDCEGQIDDLSACIKQAKCIGLRFIRQTDIITERLVGTIGVHLPSSCEHLFLQA